MAQTVQNVTLSLTLPITCHICLGKVRQPVICINNHVFCSVCIDLWLKNNSQCPACRVPITPENPCKEIIGGTSESEPMLSHTVRKHLRKTRLELLHKEYEDEIDCLQKEVDELKSKNLSLESQIKTILDPLTLMQGNQNEDKLPVADNPSKIDPETVAEWKKRLRTANEIYEKVKDDVDKLKEANKKLKLENGGLVRENLRLKAEVDNRSPQKELLLLLLSRFSCIRLCATPQTAAHQAPRPWDSPGKNSGVGCHFLLQCTKVKSESEVAQSYPTPSDPMDCSLPGPSIHGIFQARVLEWVAIAFSVTGSRSSLMLVGLPKCVEVCA